MDTMNDLLICAERLGYEARAYKDKVEILFHDQNGTVGYWWNPLTNDAQAYELLRYLLHEWYFKKKVAEFGYLVGELLNTAGKLDNKRIVEAVVAMEESK